MFTQANMAVIPGWTQLEESSARGGVGHGASPSATRGPSGGLWNADSRAQPGPTAQNAQERPERGHLRSFQAAQMYIDFENH